MKQCILYKKEKNNQVKCLACSHYCIISNNKTGICGVRKNIDGKLYLLVYGKIAAAHVDPIEKKPLYHFLPGTFAYSIGTVGCNFKCDFCQNWDISQKSKAGMILGKDMSPKQVVDAALGSGCKSIAYTYNEPIIFAEYIHDCSKLAKEKGLKNIMVTNGYWTKESFDYLKADIDAVNIDLKGDVEFYKKLCGGRLKPVLDTIKRCNDNNIHVEITTLLMNDLNDTRQGLNRIALFIAAINKNIPWHISRFFPNYKMLDKEMTKRSSMDLAKEIGKKAGLNNVYLGNV